MGNRSGASLRGGRLPEGGLGNVVTYFREVQYLLELTLLAWFWKTSIVYASAWVGRPADWLDGLWALYLSNPMNEIVLDFQRALYSETTPAGRDGLVPVLIDEPLGFVERLAYVGVGQR